MLLIVQIKYKYLLQGNYILSSIDRHKFISLINPPQQPAN